MKELSKLSNSLESTLRDENLNSVISDLGEVIIDGVLDEGLLKDVPLLSSLIGLNKTLKNYKDALFLKKLIHFLANLEDTPFEERSKLISDIEQSKDYRVKVGEKLLYILDKCEDHFNAECCASLFNAFLAKKISYLEFLRSSSIIQSILEPDLKEFLSKEKYEIEREIDKRWGRELGEFDISWINNGLCMSNPGKIEIKEDSTLSYIIGDKDTKEYYGNANKVNIKITPIGLIIREVLQQNANIT